jgi:transcriptional regulator with PAS, ATPase and Fis domain
MSDWKSYLPVGEPLFVVERHFILETLKAHKGNKTQAAKKLRISIRTLRSKIRSYEAWGWEVAKYEGRGKSTKRKKGD